MPVSEFSWTSAEYQPPIFQVYGTKRKADPCHNGPQELQDPSKRHCTWGHSAQTQEMNATQGNDNMQCVSTESMTPSLSPGKVHPQLQHVAQMHAQRIPSPWPSESMETRANSHHSNHTLPPRQPPLQDDYAQGDHVMDLNGELYNPLSPEAAMDSDFVPDPQQYRDSSRTTEVTHRVSGMGDGIHTASMVKCYCRPSWDGYSPSKPYVSDYY